jgi:hypothetical protein
MPPIPLGPAFEDWRAKLPKPARDALDQKLAAVETDKSIVHGHPRAAYAMRTKALKLAVADGYEKPRPAGAKRPQR